VGAAVRRGPRVCVSRRVRGRGLRPRRPHALRPVGQADHAVLVRLTGRRRQLAGRGPVGEQPRTGPAGKRVDEQIQLVDRPSASIARIGVPLPLTWRPPSTSSFRPRITSGRTVR
jgi:hypothetical protein